MPPFVFAVLFVPSFNVLSGYFYVSLVLVAVPTVLDYEQSLAFLWFSEGSVRELVVHTVWIFLFPSPSPQTFLWEIIMKARIMGGTLLVFSRETPWARGCLPITPCVPCCTCFIAFTFKYQAPMNIVLSFVKRWTRLNWKISRSWTLTWMVDDWTSPTRLSLSRTRSLSEFQFVMHARHAPSRTFFWSIT